MEPRRSMLDRFPITLRTDRSGDVPAGVSTQDRSSDAGETAGTR
jgi:hypothetical protein